MVFNEGTNAITSGVEKADCLKAMFAVASPTGQGGPCNRYVQENACKAFFTAKDSCRKLVAGKTTTLGHKDCADCTAGDDKAHCVKAVKYYQVFKHKMRQSFCQFTDASCQAKLKEKAEDDLGVIAIVGGIFCFFFLIILYFTYRGVVVYMTSEDDE